VTEMLYGRPGDEYMESDPHDVWERWWDDGSVGDAKIEEWSTIGLDGILASGAVIAERVAEWTYDEHAMSDSAGEELSRAAGDPEVIAAFDAARDIMAKKAGTGWLFSHRLLRTGTMRTVGSAESTTNPIDGVIDWDEP
jgi:hypothetical protein